MAIWPFGRKSKKTANADDAPMAATRSATAPDVARKTTAAEVSDVGVPTLRRRPSRRESQKRPRSTSRKLSKANAPSIRNAERVEAIPPIPVLPDERRKQLNERSGANKSNQQSALTTVPLDRGDIPSYYFQNAASSSSLQPEHFNVIRQPPTLQQKPSMNDYSLSRRKSSKRKADDRAREQEIKAMSSPIPIPKRPTSYQTSPLARDSRQIPGGMNRNLERPLSEVSLPMAESMQSQMSGTPDQHAFKVSALDALSPRPTIRYSGNPRSPAGSVGPSRTSTRKDKQLVIPEETINSRKRIDDLADEMDAGSLRELMERDRRRHEKRRRSEHEKLQRKLERKAAKQREREGQEAEKAEEVMGLGLETGDESTTPKIADPPVETPQEARVKTPESWLHDPSREQVSLDNPFHDPIAGGSTSHLEDMTPIEERDVPVLETAKAIRMSSASMSPPTSPSRHAHEPSNLSQFSELAQASSLDMVEKLEPGRRDSDMSNRFSTSWRSIFRRSDTRLKRDSADRGRVTTPSEFSNTSRESVRAQMPPSAFARIPTARSTTPKRAGISRFREDLPELPISPPDSRIQSPGAESPSPLLPTSEPYGTDIAAELAADETKRLSDIHPAYREEVALSRHASLRANSPEGPNAANLSQSLASVDSEGSWLTGRPVKRLSHPQPLRESTGSLGQRMEELTGSDEEIPGTPEEQKYMGTLTPAPMERPTIPQRKRPFLSRGSGVGSDDEDDSPLHPAPVAHLEDEGTWHGAIGKHPTIVRQGPGPRAKSREGLLNDFQAAGAIQTSGGDLSPSQSQSQGSSPSADSPDSPEGGLMIQRATSVDFGKGHARHISAGSARLLNLPPRSSQEMKRMSAASSSERSPLGASSYPASPQLPSTAKSENDEVD